MYKNQDSPYEQMIWNRTRFPKAAFFREMDQIPISESELTEGGYLLTIGDRGSLLAHPVFHDGDVYRRVADSSKPVYGSISVLRLFDLECFLLSERDVIQRALDRADPKRIERLSDGRGFDVAMLDQWPMVTSHPYSCGVYLEGEDVRTLNIEPTADYNKSNVRFREIRELSDGSLLNRLCSRLSSLA